MAKVFKRRLVRRDSVNWHWLSVPVETKETIQEVEFRDFTADMERQGRKSETIQE